MKYETNIKTAISTSIGQWLEKENGTSPDTLLDFKITPIDNKETTVTSQPSMDTGTQNLLVYPINHLFLSFITEKCFLTVRFDRRVNAG